MTPLTCYVHNGPYVAVDGLDGCQHEVCVRLRESSIPGRVVTGVGETHSEFWKKQQHAEFKRDMDAYAGARRAGLQPDRVSRAAVERAERNAYVEDRLVRRAG